MFTLNLFDAFQGFRSSAVYRKIAISQAPVANSQQALAHAVHRIREDVA